MTGIEDEVTIAFRQVAEALRNPTIAVETKELLMELMDLIHDLDQSRQHFRLSLDIAARQLGKRGKQ